MADIVDPSKLKVAELRAELTARGLDSKGNKPVLVERLREAIAAEQEEAPKENVDDQEPEPEEEVEDVENEQDYEVEAQETEENKPEEEVSAAPEEVQEENADTNKAEDPSTFETDQEEQVDDTSGDVNASGATEKAKDDFEEAPVEQLDDDELKKEILADEEEQLEESEDKSAVDLIKEDFFNGHTEELQGLEEEEVKEEEPDTKPMETGAQEDGLGLKTEEAEAEGAEDESWDHKRGRKRGASPVKTEEEDTNAAKKSRSDMDVCIISGQEDAFDKSLLVLDMYNSDLSLKIDTTTRLSALPMCDKSFCYMWHGVRGTYGFTEGRVFFEVTIVRDCEVPQLEESEQHPHVIRVGWSVDDSTLTLGEEPNGWGYGGTGKISTDLKFKDYGEPFKAGDIVGAYLDLDSEPMVMSFTVNGKHQGIAYEIPRADLNGQALFPHILTKNTEFKVNFGTEEPAHTPLEGYTIAGLVPLANRIQASQGPSSRSDCEVIMMVGLPAAGKTTWVQNYCRENRHMKFNVLGSNDLIDKMKVQGMKRKRNYAGRWDQLISACTRSLNDLLHLAYNKHRNYIIDQTNVYPSAQKRKMRGFAGFKRRAVVICPSDEDLKQRTLKREKEEGKDVPDSAVLEMKANFKLPEVGEFFDSVEFVELSGDEAQALIETYNKEGQAACPNKANNRSDGGGYRRDYNDRRDNYRSGSYNSGGGSYNYRGGWDRDRDRRGGYDRRERGGGGWNRNGRDITSRLGTGGGYNRDNRSGSGGYNRDNRGSYNTRGGYRDNRGGRSYQSGGSYKGSDTSYQAGGWSQSSQYGQSYGSYPQQSTTYGGQSYGSTAAAATPSYGQSSYGWNQQPQQYYSQPAAGAQSYYSQGYRSDTSTAASASAWGSSGTAASAWAQPASSWGHAASAPTAASATPSAAAQGAWGTASYSQPAAQQTWSQQSYGSYYGRK
ncbi:heterogeneous nuclear ribonucleoprotein U-like protein 1 isoform X2 [Hyalella azteca]|uniref:Heterogeneous nuclear ribonucleoprotein U-like protein 1 isoform X2 n=1 Tax=Hyalella azteca TaxID=294128 RepID=A0A8B7NQ22_HYAAZ|nr:heterogeneous nuclear ribonucleoprotein U-like protein 1 isoform X2 [Hyalella azteca]